MSLASSLAISTGWPAGWRKAVCPWSTQGTGSKRRSPNARCSLLEKNEELREIDTSRRRFLADVSHELRTPLTAIVGEADVTLKIAGNDAEACRAALYSILANSTYLNRRIADLMALARSSDGQLDIEKRTVDLNVVATDAMAEIASLAKINGVTTTFRPLAAPVSSSMAIRRACGSA